MIARFLGILDFLTAISIVFLAFGAEGFAVLMALILLVKSLIFITSFASWIDILSGIGILVCVYSGFNPILWIVFLWLLQKAVVSWFSE
ncbi:MAG TPA: hypothetical protein VJJ21_00120 [Candidatus Nanoarchaeia archaeon]|nr:hypothetical protein [Candidatus Nanoarchaeia archaeon]